MYFQTFTEQNRRLGMLVYSATYSCALQGEQPACQTDIEVLGLRSMLALRLKLPILWALPMQLVWVHSRQVSKCWAGR